MTTATRPNPIREHIEFGHRIELTRSRPPSRAELYDIWEHIKPDLLVQWVKKHPGSRPFYWWRHDAPELRQRIDGKPHPFNDPEYIAKAKSIREQHPNGIDLFKVSWGRPAYISDREGYSVYETQADYLRRLDLLLPGEAEAIDARNGPDPVALLR